MGKTQLAVVGLVTVALIAAYVIVTVTNHDGTGLLGALIGWLGGAGVAPAIDKARVTP